MQRDEIAGRYMGLGHLDGQRTRENTENAGDPNQGLIGKYLDDRPVAKFLTTAAATVAGGIVAGSLVRRGGRRAVKHSVRNYGRGWDRNLKSFREIQSYLDELEGVHRRRGKYSVRKRDGKIEWRDDPTRDEVTSIHGFHQTESSIATGEQLGTEPAKRWLLRDELQKRMVREGRRLPYELPGAYVAQKTIFDRLLGEEEERQEVDWSDPLDVAGDLVEESAKNIAFGFAPFAGGQAAARQGWRRAMSLGEQITTGYTGNVSDFTVGMHSTLKMVGHESSDVIRRTINISHRSGGALASALRESAGRTRPANEALERFKTSPTGVARHQRVAHGATPPPTGPLGQTRTFWQKLRDEWRVRAQTERKFSPHGTTQFERASHATGRLRGSEDDILSGEFGEQIAESNYTQRLKNHLVGSGVDEEVAEGFLRHGRVRAPIRYGQNTDLSRRVRLGQRPILDEGDDFWKTIQQRSDAIVGQGSGSQIRANLEDAIRRADQDFVQNRGVLEQQTQRLFDQTFDRALVPGVDDMLGQRRLPFNRVQDPTSPNAENFLLHQTARRLGISSHTSTGVRRRGDELRTQIRDRGLDAEDPYSLRSYLIEQGDISPPWNPEGRNIFGLRPLSVNDAMRRGVFSETEEAPEMQRLARGIDEADDAGFALDRAKVGGLHEGPTGEIVDIGSVRHGIRNAVDRFAEEFQIPLLKVRPFQISGYGSSRRMATGSAIRYSGPEDRQIALGDDVDDTLGSLWFQRSGSKGGITALGVDDAGMSPTQVAGQFRPNPTDPTSSMGRFARRISGDEGAARIGGDTSWQQRMDVHPQQESSLLNLWRRARLDKKELDIREPNQMAQMLNRAGREGLESADPRSAAVGMRGLAANFRDSGFGRNVLRNADPQRAISRNMRYGNRDLIDMESQDLRRTVRELFAENLDDLPADSRRQVDRARRDLLNRWRNAGVDEIDQPTPQAMRTTGMHRRSDELRMDIARYLATRSSIRQPSRSFYDELDDMGRELDDLYQRGAISRQDLAESRSAIASFQLASTSVLRHDSSKALRGAALDLADSLFTGPPAIRQALEDFASYQNRFSGPVGRNLFGPAKARMGLRASSEDVINYNPLSEGQNMLFTPTMGTAFSRNPLRAAAHGLGFTDYMPSQAQYASPLSSWTSHMFTRMNDVTKFAHMGVREGGRYAGSLDMYARGMIGKRALPLVAGGATALTADRQLGYTVHQNEGPRGEPIYEPLVLGALGNIAKEAQVAASAAWPGGMSGEERRQQLEQGDVPIRRGRFWPFSSEPWRGGDVKYYRPSWYQRLMGAPQYTDQQYGTPTERLMFGYDFSPGRLIDPYHYDKKHGAERPMPVTGDYFTGPWGPLRGVLNATVGQVLKPKQIMHRDALQGGASRVSRVGSGIGITEGQSPSAVVAGDAQTAQSAEYEQAANTPAYPSGSVAAGQEIYRQSAELAEEGRRPSRGRGGGTLSPSDFKYSNMPDTIGGGSRVQMSGSASHQMRDVAYQAEQWAGIYGFAFGAVRENLGFGQSGFPANKVTLPSTSQAFGQHAQFWDWDIGGLGDVPTPLEGQFGSLQISELARRFVGGERRQNEFNPIPNALGRRHPWLPGGDSYYRNFHTGDMYSELQSGLLRLPGQNYERFNRLHPDKAGGRYGTLDRLRILGNVAADSRSYNRLEDQVVSNLGSMNQYSQEHAMESMRRAEQIRRRHNFESTEYRYSSPLEKGQDPFSFYAGKAWEEFSHMDTPFHSKFLNNQTAYEAWEDENVYGVPFAPWEQPIESFVEPSLQKSTQRNPVVGAAYLGGIGSLFGASREARLVGGMIGGAVGAIGGLFGDVHQAATGERHLPEDYKKQVAIQEHTDILEYTRARRARNTSLKHDNQEYARYFQQQMQETMYGADVYNSSVEELAETVPENKEEQFKMMAHAPVGARDRVLSTAGRLERRLYQGLWGREVESRPGLRQYFQDRELPPSDWSGWSPRANMENVEIKMLQDQGLNASRLGYYPQQIQEANVVNPTYPELVGESNARLEDVLQQEQVTRREVQALMRQQGASGQVRARQNPTGRRQVIVSHGG